MKKLIREYTPFIILAYSFLFAIASYFEFYRVWFKYLPDMVGFSLFTNVFMYSVYMNKKYCNATKFCVVGLIILNLLNIVYLVFDLNGAIYDIYLLAIISLVLIFKKIA